MDLLEIDITYKRGLRTFIHYFFTYGWWLSLIGIHFLYLAFAMYWGSLVVWTTNFLAGYPDLYITSSMLATWVALVGISFIFIAFLRAHVMFGKYKFILDEHAFRLQKGLFRIREFTFPYNQIANVHIEQPYHWRMLGLASVDIISASDMTPTSDKRKKESYLIPIIDKRLAKQLRLQLMRYGSGESSPLDDLYEDDDYDDDILYSEAEENSVHVRDTDKPRAEVH